MPYQKVRELERIMRRLSEAERGQDRFLDGRKMGYNENHPAFFNGEGRDPVFQLPIAAGFEGLQTRADRGPNDPHRLVEPARRCTLEYYESCLAATRGDWVLLNE